MKIKEEAIGLNVLGASKLRIYKTRLYDRKNIHKKYKKNIKKEREGRAD